MRPDTLIHTGELKFNKRRRLLDPRVTGSDGGLLRNKPTGENILWTSPLKAEDSERSWSHHIAAERPGEFHGVQRWWIHLSPEATIAVIDSMDDLLEFVQRYPSEDPKCVLDWELLCCEYDALWLTEKGWEETDFPAPSGYPSTHGWDCESIVIFNTRMICSLVAHGKHRDGYFRKISYGF